jgi:hypothetical protein
VQRLNLQEWQLAASAGALGLVLLVWIGYIVFRAWRKRRAERERLARIDSVCFRRLSSVLVPDGSGGQLHIDHLLLMPRGLLVIAERDLRGVIFGSQLMDDWALMPSGRGARITFANPLRPLFDRLAAVGALAGTGVPVEGRVVFPDGAQFPKGHPPMVLRDSSFATDFPEVDRALLEPDQRWVTAFDLVAAQAVAGSALVQVSAGLR